ncbi:MAG: glycosyltransferase family 4 protein [Candidatus Saccharimonadales bacterium]
MKIELLVPGRAYSFSNQARALQSALKTAGVESIVTLISANEPYVNKQDLDVIIPVCDWRDYESTIIPALNSGVPVIPWIVIDTVNGQVEGDDVGIRDGLARLPLFFTTSNFCKSNFVKIGIPAEKISILPECVDEDIWKPYTEEELQRFLDFVSIDEESKTSLPLHFNLRRAKKEGIPIIFTTGGSGIWKGTLEILKALGKIDAAKEWIYIIKTWPATGSFESGIVEMQTAKDNNVAHKLHYMSGEFADDFMVGLMNVCDIYVAVSRLEGFGLPLVEAQLCNKMVVTHNATATMETIVEGVTGLMVQAYIQPDGMARADIPDLAEKLERAIDDKELRETLSAQARQSAIDRFGKQAIGKQCLSMVRDALLKMGKNIE